jgi:hypothetical protein
MFRALYVTEQRKRSDRQSGAAHGWRRHELAGTALRPITVGWVFLWSGWGKLTKRDRQGGKASIDHRLERWYLGMHLPGTRKVRTDGVAKRGW